MNPQAMIQLLLNNLPTILSCLAALGLFKLGGQTILRLTAEGRASVKLTKSTMDDVIFELAARPLEEVAKLFANGQDEAAYKKIDEARMAAAKAIDLVKKR